MLSLGFLVDFEAQPGKEADVAQFLVDAKTLVDAEYTLSPMVGSGLRKSVGVSAPG